MNPVVDSLHALLSENVSDDAVRERNLREEATKLLQSEKSPAFASLSERVVDTIQGCILGTVKRASMSDFRGRAFGAFLLARKDALPQIWERTCGESGIPFKDPLLSQSVNRKVFERLLLSFCKASSVEVGDSMITAALSVDEENVLMYVAGYVPFKLLKKYAGKGSERTDAFCQCLRNMAAHACEESEPTQSEDHDYHFKNYMCQWICKVDRGGLFKVNEITYRFFYAMESATRLNLLLKLPKWDVLESRLQSILYVVILQ